jgi:hypothetical protein
MDVKRTAMFVVVGAALVAWLAAAATSGNRDRREPLVLKAPPIDSRGAALESEVARLHERLRPVETPRQPGRDLFAFASPKPRPAAPVHTPKPALSEAPAARPTPPPLKLSGIAEDTTPNGPVRTAIVSGFGQLFFAKEGENITDRYRVVRISPDVVELADLVEGTTLRLALK